ncbi:mCG1025821 [Mus musculus]|jgi:hypothetical protein|nr:mCG1025821 [Mus musculus]
MSRFMIQLKTNPHEQSMVGTHAAQLWYNKLECTLYALEKLKDTVHLDTPARRKCCEQTEQRLLLDGRPASVLGRKYESLRKGFISF